jgi:hypothetical protein
MLVIGGGFIMRVKETFTFLVDVVFGLRTLGDFYEFFNSGCLWADLQQWMSLG